VNPMSFVGLENFIKLFTNDEVFWKAFVNNIEYTLINVVVQITLGLIIAIILTNITRGREVFQTLYYVPVVISTVAISQIFLRVYSVEPAGLLNSFLGIFNKSLLQTEWLSSFKLALPAVALVDAYKNIGFYMVIFYSALIAIPKDVIESARIDGASGLRLYTNIILPLIKKIIITNIVLVVSGTLKSFDYAFLLTDGGPMYSTELVTTHMFRQAFSSMFYGYGSAIAVFIAVESVIVVGVIRKIFTPKAGNENG
jgi:raffinose/stachyose/melibiose transport system permease protein